MADTLTHYFPWDDSDDFAYCGYPMTAQDRHGLQPTCPTCRARLAAAEAVEAERADLEAQGARLIATYDAQYERWLAYAGPKPSRAQLEATLDDLHDQIAAAARPRPDTAGMSPVGAELFAYAVALNRSYARRVR